MMYKFLVSLIYLGTSFFLKAELDKRQLRSLTRSYIHIIKELKSPLMDNSILQKFNNLVSNDVHIVMTEPLKRIDLKDTSSYLIRLHKLLKKSSLKVIISDISENNQTVDFKYKSEGPYGCHYHDLQLFYQDDKIKKIKESITYPGFR